MKNLFYTIKNSKGEEIETAESMKELVNTLELMCRANILVRDNIVTPIGTNNQEEFEFEDSTESIETAINGALEIETEGKYYVEVESMI